MTKPFIPPGGFAGFAQQTVAGQIPGRKATTGLRTYTPRHKRKGTKAAKKYKSNKRKLKRMNGAKKSKPARLVKGSAAAKAYMAKIRRKKK